MRGFEPLAAQFLKTGALPEHPPKTLSIRVERVFFHIAFSTSVTYLCVVEKTPPQPRTATAGEFSTTCALSVHLAILASELVDSTPLGDARWELAE